MTPLARLPKLLPCLAVMGALFLSACASGPSYTSHYDRSVDFESYQTFGFPEELGTDRAGFSTFITQYFQTATRREMEALGYTYTENNPDLLVNFFTNVREQTDVRSSPRMGVSMGYGYYGYRYGMYSAWPMYGYTSDVTTVNYEVGTANIDVIDAANNRMIWEGIAEGRLGSNAMERAEEIINTVTAEIFDRYPTASGM